MELKTAPITLFHGFRDTVGALTSYQGVPISLLCPATESSCAFGHQDVNKVKDALAPFGTTLQVTASRLLAFQFSMMSWVCLVFACDSQSNC